MKTYIRHGDVNLHPVKEPKGEEVNHDGSYILAYGETTGHKHVLTVERPQDLIIRKDTQGNMYFELKVEGKLTHEEHKTIEVPIGIYRQVQERELDHFADSVERKVID